MDARDDAEVVADWIRITSDEYGDPAPSVVDAIVEGRALDEAWAWSLSETPPDEHCHHFGHPPWHHTRHQHRAHPKMWRSTSALITQPSGIDGADNVRRLEEAVRAAADFELDWGRPAQWQCRCVSDPVIPWEE